MKKTSLVLALVVSISGVSPLLANEVKQQTKQNVEGDIQQGQEDNTSQTDQENNGAQPETKQTPTNTNVDWTQPGMKLSDWQYEDVKGNKLLSKYIGRQSDEVYVPAYFKEDTPFARTILKGSILEGTTIKKLTIVNFPGSKDSAEHVEFADVSKHSSIGTEALQIPDNSIVSSIEFIGGTGNMDFEGSEIRAQNNDFIDLKGVDASHIGIYGNVVKVNGNGLLSTVSTDLKYAEFINAKAINVVKSGAKRANPNPLYMQSKIISYWPSNLRDDSITLENHYQLNQLLDGMGIKSTMQLKLDANGGNGGVIIRQPIFFLNSLTKEQQNQIYDSEQDLDACIRIAFLENPTYFPTLEGRTFLGWEKQPTNTREVAYAFNQTYLAKWSDPVPVPTVTPTQPQLPVTENKPTSSVNTANSATAITLATVALAGCVGLITLRRFK